MEMTATPEELLGVMRELFPREYDRAVAELTIRKQQAHIDQLTAQLAQTLPEGPETHAHSHG